MKVKWMLVNIPCKDEITNKLTADIKNPDVFVLLLIGSLHLVKKYIWTKNEKGLMLFRR